MRWSFGRVPGDDDPLQLDFFDNDEWWQFLDEPYIPEDDEDEHEDDAD